MFSARHRFLSELRRCCTERSSLDLHVWPTGIFRDRTWLPRVCSATSTGICAAPPLSVASRKSPFRAVSKVTGGASVRLASAYPRIFKSSLLARVFSSCTASHTPIRNIGSSARYLGFSLPPHFHRDAIPQGPRDFAPSSGAPSALLHIGYSTYNIRLPRLASHRQTRVPSAFHRSTRRPASQTSPTPLKMASTTAAMRPSASLPPRRRAASCCAIALRRNASSTMPLVRRASLAAPN